MDESFVISLAQNAVVLTVLIAAPFLLISLLIGSLVSMIQAATQINEITLTFIPKMIGIILIILVLGSWLLQQLVTFTATLFNGLPNLVP